MRKIYFNPSLCKENNRIVAEVSPGWWTGRISFGFYGFKPMAFAGEIEIEYADGENEIIASGEDWKAAICGPVMFADIWDGEYYDATVPEPSIAPEAHEWVNAIHFTDCTCEIVPLVGPAIRPRHELLLRPISAVCHNGTIHDGSEYGEINILSKSVGDWCEQTRLEFGEALILDMGQNMVGRPILMFKAPRGTRLTQSEDGKRLYIHLIEYPYAFLEFENLADKIDYAQILNDGSEVLYTKGGVDHFSEARSQKEGLVAFKIPAIQPNTLVPVIEVFLK